ncbi:MAG TPA: ATP-dependent Clp protease proteolytic subunit [Candidatus Moranbacteria bacterium]|nr:ATP-dependent Clp protease proteolytic subunit [Candidatus Moranbacteria bacterium]
MSLNDVNAGLLKKRIIEISGDTEENMENYVHECLRTLKSEGNPDVTIEIKSNGGRVDIGLNIFDMLRLYSGKKTGKVVGFARSMAAVILQACDKRLCAKHAKIMIHHISRGSVSLDVMRDKKKMKETLAATEESQDFIYDVLCKSTKHDKSTIKKVCAEDRDMTAKEALRFGLIDKII